jgi:hypothetical protein
MIDRPSAPPPPVPRAEPGVAPHRGVVILVLGICSFVTNCFVLGIVAWAMGNRDLREMEEGRMDREGLGLTQAGRIVGMVHVILSCLGFAVGIVFLIFFATASFEGAR